MLSPESLSPRFSDHLVSEATTINKSLFKFDTSFTIVPDIGKVYLLGSRKIGYDQAGYAIHDGIVKSTSDLQNSSDANDLYELNIGINRAKGDVLCHLTIPGISHRFRAVAMYPRIIYKSFPDFSIFTGFWEINGSHHEKARPLYVPVTRDALSNMQFNFEMIKPSRAA